MDDIVKEFVVESHDNLNQLDQDLVALEKEPGSPELIARIFRAIHTIKGVAGFLSFSKLEAVSHSGESLLAKLRDGKLLVNPEIISVLLATIDAIRQMLNAVENDGNDGETLYTELVERLEKLEAAGHESANSAAEASPSGAAEPPHPEASGITDAEPAPVSHPQDFAAAEETASESGSAHANAAPVRRKSAAEETESPRTNANGAADHAHPSGAGASAVDANIRVNVSLLDRLMNLVGELVLARNQILQFSARTHDAGFLATVQRLNLITTELQEGIMKTRMQPIGNVWNKFPRLVRDLATICGKQVRIEMEGEDTELDKTLIEAIRDPLTHIVRNAIDHGIEPPAERVAAGKAAQGCLFLRAFHESGQVNIEISDDGGGINLERVRAKALERGLITHDQASQMDDNAVLNLIFAPGFSTAAKVTNVSGRGVGMDVVKTNIEKIGGTVDVQSLAGRGTTLKVRIPLTLAIIPALVVTCDGDRYAIPQVSLIELVRLEGDEVGRRIETIHGAPVYRLRGHLLPLVYLRQVLNLAGNFDAGAKREAAHIVVLQVGERQFGLVVDEVNDTEEIVVKPLGKQLKGIAAFAGATIMGDGKVALILDALGIAQLSGVLAESHEAARADDRHEARAGGSRQRLLLFQAAGFERLAMPLSLVARLEEFPRAQLEHAAGSRVVQYRGRILPLVRLETLLGSMRAEENADAQSVQVVVIGQGERAIGIEVDHILDIVEEQINAPQMTERPGLLGSAILGQRITDFLDVRAVVRETGQNWFAGGSLSASGRASVLLVDHQTFSRELVRSYLDMAGHCVTEASEPAEACEKLASGAFDVAVMSLELPDEGAFRLLGEIRNRPGQYMPVLALARREGETPAAHPQNQDARFDDCQAKFDRPAVLRSIAKMLGAGNQAGAEYDNSSGLVMEA